MKYGTVLFLLSFPFILNVWSRNMPWKPRLHSEKLNAAIRLLDGEMASGRVSAASVLVRHNGVVAVQRAFGHFSR